MNVITKIGTVSNISYTSRQVTEEVKEELLSFTLEYAAGQTVAVRCYDDSLVNEIRGKLKDGDKVTVIGLLKESEFFIDKDTVIRGVGILTEDDTVYPKYFGKDLALKYRQQELNMQELLKVSEQFADENDPF
ncbi:hypothetical protein [Candidatus Pseudoruminococcus sp.]|uniref:hypothetical protein n=1 Tax=Candidatus Pseudoruminococcus sp. TaxID=3101048 RepID=UPI00399982D7